MTLKNTNLSEDKETTHYNLHHWDKPFWRSVVSSELGNGSTSRVTTVAIIGTTLIILIYLVLRNDKIPDNLIELAWFSSLLITAVYSPAKLAEIFKTFASKK
jgi:hypothetical protein